ncbi:MAG: hypothetical protein KDK12_12370 [Rhodobacteraceae bacterium]|nr:hypothetical protein [Paracoccaceae bacterium]
MTGLAVAVLLSNPASASCEIELRIRNVGGHRVELSIHDAWVRSSLTQIPMPPVWGGWLGVSYLGWRAPAQTPRGIVWLSPNREAVDTLTATFACAARRQFQTQYRCLEGREEGNAFFAEVGPNTGISDRGRRVVLPVGQRC